MWTGLTESSGVTVEPGEPGVIGLPGVATVPCLPCVVGDTGYRVPVPVDRPLPGLPGPGVTRHVQSTLVDRQVTAEPTLS